MKYNLQFIIVFFSFQYLSNMKAIFTSSTMENETCVLDQGVHFKNMYKDIQRRQIEHEQGLAQAMFPEIHGPKRDLSYNPNYGYEPYWAGGDWVYTEAPNKTTMGTEGENCGAPCQEMLQYYGTICGRDRDYNYKTFDNYCELYNEDCTLRAGWLIVHRGECQEEFKTYPTDGGQIVTRAESYVSQFAYDNIVTDIMYNPMFHRPQPTRKL